MIIGPIIDKTKSTLYCLDSDESHITCDRDLTEYEKEQDDLYVKGNSGFALSMQINTDSSDGVILDEEYLKHQNLLERLYTTRDHLGIAFSKKTYFSKPKNFISKADTLRDQYQIISTISYSYLLKKINSLSAFIKASTKINSKNYIATIHNQYNIPTPQTKIINIGGIRGLGEGEFIYPFYIKCDGLGGGAHVHKVTNHNDIAQIEQKYPEEHLCTIQEKVDPKYIETAITCEIGADQIIITNARFKLVHEGARYGNIFRAHTVLRDTHKAKVLELCQIIRKEGYIGIIGFDAFIYKDDILFTDINARYLGNTPAERILMKLGLINTVDAVFTSTDIHSSEWDVFTNLLTEYNSSEQRFQNFIIPMSFGAYIENSSISVTLLIVGDFYHFYEALQNIGFNKSFENIDITRTIYSIYAMQETYLNS